MILLTAFAALALLLAALGIYGVISYSVSQRTRELGIRIALGATQERVVRLVLGQGMALTSVGIAAGLVGAYWLVRLLASMLFGVTATDAPTFAGVSVVLLGVAGAASYLPARRAARVDPVTAMRAE
jgi:putative ABC transport system permease protein